MKCSAWLFAADRSGQVEVVVWNSLCRQLFGRLRIEDTVAVIGYRVKRAYGKSSGIEVSVNPRNSPGQVLLLTSTAPRFPSFTFAGAAPDEGPHPSRPGGQVRTIGRCRPPRSRRGTRQSR